jgi:hydrogenase nickel incorporation protein HypA/HybF
MHEVAIATELVSKATEAASEHGASRVDSLTVEVGRATHVNPRQLRYTIETVARDTMAAEATVSVETVEPYATCDCGWEGTPETLDSTYVVAPNVTCPDCGERVTFRRGRECRLASVSVPDSSPETHQ